MIDDPLYEALFNLLEQQQWREADQETYRLMLELCDRTEEGWLRREDILDFPCVELRTIDGLWLHYSHQKFGFSVQKAIYEPIQKNTENQAEIAQKLGHTVGWCVEGSWLTYPELTFHLAAPKGHLPRYATLHTSVSTDLKTEEFWGQYLFSRMKFCDENPDQWIESLIGEGDDDEAISDVTSSQKMDPLIGKGDDDEAISDITSSQRMDSLISEGEDDDEAISDVTSSENSI
ncbi:MAG: GUN4 domain-containing protein [Microcystaceae cyanobacterium]